MIEIEAEDGFAELVEDFNDIASEVVEELGIEVLCELVAMHMHVSVCEDDSVKPQYKAAKVMLLSARHISPLAIAHFDMTNAAERLSDFAECAKSGETIH